MTCRCLALGSGSSGSSGGSGVGRRQRSETGRELAGDLRNSAGRRDDGDEATLITLAAETLNTITRWEKCVESLDERRMAAEERGDAVDDAGRIDAA